MSVIANSRAGYFVDHVRTTNEWFDVPLIRASIAQDDGQNPRGEFRLTPHVLHQ